MGRTGAWRAVTANTSSKTRRTGPVRPRGELRVQQAVLAHRKLQNGEVSGRIVLLPGRG
jgi:hypothetical protein